MMDLDELRTVRRTEREKDSLQHLRDSFYEDVAAYLADLEARRDRAAAEADDPFASQEVRKLTDKIETAEEVSEAIYERRVGKIVKQASFAAADMSADREGLTEQETDLFDDLVARIKQNKTTVLDILAGETDVAAGDDVATADVATADAATGDGSPAEPSAAETETGGGMLASAMGGQDSDPGAAGRDSVEGVPERDDSPERPPPAATAGGPGDGEPEESAAANAPQPAERPSAAADATPEHAEAGPGSASGSTDPSAELTEVEPVAGPPGSPTETDASPVPTASDERASSTTERDSQSGGDDGTDPTPTTDGGAAQLQRTTVRITRDVGAILGVDEREYDLEREDVVTLPSTNAEPLVERDAAERLE